MDHESPSPDRNPGSAIVRRLPAAVVGILLGVSSITAVWTTPWWAGVLGIRPQAVGPQSRPTGQVSPCLGDSACLTPGALSREQQRLIALVAGERARAGCRPAELDRRLQKAGQTYAEAIGSGVRPSHTDREQRTPQDRAEAAGYYGGVKENLAIGLTSPDDVMDMWLGPSLDPSLRTRLIDCTVVSLGLGHSSAQASDAYGPGIWVLLLGQSESG